MCPMFQVCPRESHFNIVKKSRYLNGTLHHNIQFPNGSKCSLIGFPDSDFTGCMLDRKNTSGKCHLFGNYLVYWNSKNQHNVSLSTVEAEYVAASNFCAQVLWLKKQLLDYDLKLGCVLIKCDKTSTISLNKNLVLHSHTKHIEDNHHFLRYHVEKYKFIFEHVDTKNQLADIFTKSLSSEPFIRFLGNWESHIHIALNRFGFHSYILIT